MNAKRELKHWIVSILGGIYGLSVREAVRCDRRRWRLNWNFLQLLWFWDIFGTFRTKIGFVLMNLYLFLPPKCVIKMEYAACFCTSTRKNKTIWRYQKEGYPMWYTLCLCLRKTQVERKKTPQSENKKLNPHSIAQAERYARVVLLWANKQMNERMKEREASDRARELNEFPTTTDSTHKTPQRSVCVCIAFF